MSAEGQPEENSRAPNVLGAVTTISTGAVAKIKHVVSEGWSTYPNGKGAEMKYGCCDATPGDAVFINRLRADLAGSYYWSGSFCLDYFFFVCQWQPFIGMLLSHPNHPWTKTQRVLMFVVSLSFSVMPAAAIARIPVAPVAFFMTLMLVTLPNTVWGVLMYQCAIGDTRCPLCSCCVHIFRNCLFCFAIFTSITGSGIAYFVLVAAHDGDHGGPPWQKMLDSLFMGQAYAQALWFPMWFFLPCQLGFYSLWTCEKKAEEKKAEDASPADVIGAAELGEEKF